MATRAFELRRAWRALEPDALVDVGLSHVDILVLSLLIDLAAPQRLSCADAAVADRLTEAFARSGRDLDCTAAPAAGDALMLVPAEALADLDVASAADRPVVVYGLREFTPVASRNAALGPVSLLPLCSRSAALWQCGLGLAAPPASRTIVENIGREVAQAMRGEWIDPLLLFETVQRLSARLRAAGLADEDDPVPDAEDRIATLEAELAALKKAALIRQHLQLVETATEQARASA